MSAKGCRCFPSKFQSILNLKSCIMKKQILFLLGFLLCCSFAKAQKNISGKVSGDDGNPIPGVSVRVKNSQVGVSTDASGSFNLKASADDVLIFSSVGYVSQEIKVGNRSAINVIWRWNMDRFQCDHYGRCTYWKEL